MTTFIEKVRPFLQTDDALLRNEWVSHLRNFPQVPAQLTNDLLHFATEHKEFRKKILVNGRSFLKDDRSLELLIGWLKELDIQEKLFVQGFLENVPLSLFFKHERNLAPFVSKRFMELQRELYTFDGKEGEQLIPLKQLFLMHMKKMIDDFSMDCYEEAKRILNQLITVGIYDAEEAYRTVLAEIDDEYYSDFGILAVYACGVLQVQKAMPLLVQLLERQDEDLLLEEVERALVAMQSDEVVKAIAPNVLDAEKGISVISILKQMKTSLSEQILLDAYAQTNDVEVQEFLLDALTSQFSERAIPLIEQFIKQDEYALVFDMGEMFYAHYKTLGKIHPLLDTWYKESLEKDARILDSMNHVVFPKTAPVQVEKIGRNDPCNCGSGKKFKKCCGKDL